MSRPLDAADDGDRAAKRARLDSPTAAATPSTLFDGSTSGLFKTLAPSLGIRAAVEEEVGIAEFVSPEVPPFKAIIKHRFTDFLVYEVGLDDQVVRLKDIKAPKKVKGPKPEAAAAPAAAPGPSKVPPAEPLEWTEERATLFKELLTAEKLEEFGKFVAAGRQKAGEPKATFVSSPFADKAARTGFHKALREVFPKAFESNAMVDADGGADQQAIAVSWTNYNAKGQRRDGPRPDEPPPYIHFTLQKSNKEQHDALSTLARLWGVQSRDLGTAGTKDKRAVTVQRVSLRRGTKTLESLWRSAYAAGRGRMGLDRALKIGDLEYRDDPLDLAMLNGNRFVITLRDVQPQTPSIISAAITRLGERGFLNYYGMQRFGTACVPTHSVGLALLLSDWALAVKLIMLRREGEHEDVVHARSLYFAGDVLGAAKAMPRRCVAEKAVLDYFAANKGETSNALAALGRIPRNLRMMYVHAYQSYVWNRAVSERVKRHGATEVVEGDLVLLETGSGGDPTEEGMDAREEVVEEERYQQGTLTASQAVSTSKVSAVRVLSAADVASGLYSFRSVVYPLPGYAITYPSGSMAGFYASILAEDGLEVTDLFRKQKEFSMGGDYRLLIHLPTAVSHQLLLYSRPDQDLAQPDSDALSGYAPPECTAFVGTSVPEGQHLALRVELTLKGSTYATMALRELMKSVTGAAEQRRLTAGMEQRFKEADEAATAKQAVTELAGTEEVKGGEVNEAVVVVDGAVE